MGINYKVREILYKGKVDDIVFDFPKEYELLSTFLSVDVKPFKDYVLQAFNKVLSGESSLEEINCNVCGAKIERDKTMVYDNLAEDSLGNYCVVDTKELLDIIKAWIKAIM